MERLRFRATSTLALLAELRQQDLLEDARRIGIERRGRVRSRAAGGAGLMGLSWLRRPKS